jgi:hypothetical protein
MQEPGEVVRVAGQERVARLNEQCNMSVYYIWSSARIQQLTDPAAGEIVQCHHINATEQANEVDLPGAITPNLGHRPSAGTDELFISAGDLQCRPDRPTALVYRHESAAVEDQSHVNLRGAQAHRQRAWP